MKINILFVTDVAFTKSILMGAGSIGVEAGGAGSAGLLLAIVGVVEGGQGLNHLSQANSRYQP